MERESNRQGDGSDHKESEIPLASSSTGLYKRPRTSPTRLTPQQCQKRVPLREIQLTSTRSNSTQRLEPRRLSYQYTHTRNSTSGKWTTAEIKALVEFILFHSTGDIWPCHKQMVFWTNAGEFVQTRSASDTCRSGMLFKMSV